MCQTFTEARGRHRAPIPAREISTPMPEGLPSGRELGWVERGGIWWLGPWSRSFMRTPASAPMRITV
jgi:hypothetical protein